MTLRRPAMLAGAVVLALARLATAQPSPYAGLEGREVKALSPEQIEGYLTGQGMSLALAAELNGYPGPKHVLELAGQLGLTAEQRTQVEASYDAMHQEAVRLGRAIVEAEGRLDRLFAAGEASAESLGATLDELARLQGALRYAHLAAHLRMKAVLSASQVERYVELRGYAAGDPHEHDPSRHGQSGHGGRPMP